MSFQFCWRISAICTQAALSADVRISNFNGLPSFERMPPLPTFQPAWSSSAAAFALSKLSAGFPFGSFGHHEVGNTPVELGIEPYLKSAELLIPLMSAAYQSAWRTTLSPKILLAGAEGSRLNHIRGPCPTV